MNFGEEGRGDNDWLKVTQQVSGRVRTAIRFRLPAPSGQILAGGHAGGRGTPGPHFCLAGCQAACVPQDPAPHHSAFGQCSRVLSPFC